MSKKYLAVKNHIATPTAGSVPYMAPEQLLARPVDLRTDMYAAGMIFYEMLTGIRLFEGITIEEISKNKLSRNYADMRDINSIYKEVIELLTHPDINKRPKTYLELLEIIDTWIKPDRCAKKLAFYKKDHRLPVSDQGIVYAWMRLFPNRIEEDTTLVTMRSHALVDFKKAVDFHELGKHIEAIGCCNRILQSGDKDTNFDAYILKSVEPDENPLKLKEEGAGKRILNYEVAGLNSLLSYNALQQLFISAVEYIESGGNEHAAIALINEYASLSLQCTSLPEEHSSLLAQVLVKTQRHSEAINLLTSLIESNSIPVRFKSELPPKNSLPRVT